VPILVVGVNHKTAPLELRSRVAFADAEASKVLFAILALPSVEECVLLSTCNRTEVYVHASHDPNSDILRTLCSIKRLPVTTLSVACVSLQGASAVRHVFRVAAGLESLVMGEAQILGQVRSAYKTARELHTTGPVLNRVMQLAMGAGRRVRRETALGTRNVSAAHAALSACRQTFGSIDGRRVLIIGAGEMAALAVKVFAQARARITAVANRDLNAARVLADRTHARAISLHDLPQVLAEVDAVVVAVGAGEPVLRREHMELSAARTPALLILDLGMPRGVDADVGALPGVIVYDLDRLSEFLPPAPADTIAAAGRLVDEAADRFVRWYASRAAQPIVAGLRRRADEIAELAYERLQPRLQSLDARGRARVRGAMHTALRRLLHGPTVRLKEAAMNRHVLELAKDLFDLNGEEEQG
jgi:glutamyl-tRNA reductase